MGLMNMMVYKLKDEKTLTENGAVAYATSGKELLDYNFHVSVYRNDSVEDIIYAFAKVFEEDKETAIKYLFYLGDIRQGLGERKQFRAGLEYLATYHPDIANKVIEFIPEYNRFDTILLFLDFEETRDATIRFIRKQLEADLEAAMEEKPISLLAKWLPSVNTSSKETRRLARIVADGLGLDEWRYRKTLAKLRKYLDVVEVKMSAGQWGQIDYAKVPSKANLKYSYAFARNDGIRRAEYLDSLKKGNAKINAGVLQPHEIVCKYNEYGCIEDTLEELWKALPDLTVSNTLIVRDGSGSMTWAPISSVRPLDVATALAIYMSERNTGEWKDKFITFSSHPKIVNLSNAESLYEKINICRRETDCSNTDIYRTMRLILDTAVENHIEQSDMPEMVVICSDMQFDGRYHNMNESLFDTIAEEFRKAGYKLPRICFWNLAGDVKNTIPMQQNELGLILCSGFSVQLLNMFFSNKVDPYEVLLDTLNSGRYDPVVEAIKYLL